MIVANPTEATQTLPDEGGHFGPYGGRYVPETLMTLLEDLETAYREAKDDPAFQAELDDLLDADGDTDDPETEAPDDAPR